MIFRKNYVLRATAGASDAGGGDAGGEEIVLDDPAGAVDDDPADPVDRGDDVDPLDPKALAKVAAGADDDPDPADPAAAEPGKKGGSNHVPIGRFNEVNEEKKRLERENAELKAAAGKPAVAEPAKKDEPPAFDEDKAELQYANLLAEGKFPEAVALRKDINKNIREQAREQAETNVETRQAQRQTAQTLTEVATQAVKDWPYLDTEDGAETMDLIIAARDGYVAKGMDVAQALKAAVAKIAPKFAPEGSATPGKDLSKGASAVDTRSQQAAARGAAASGQQPPRVDVGAGNRATEGKVNVEDMTEDQFDALTPQQKSRLRGDA